MSSHALPRFNPGDRVVKSVNGDVLQVVNTYALFGTNFLHQRFVKSHNVCVEPIDVFGNSCPEDRHVVHELELELFQDIAGAQPVARTAAYVPDHVVSASRSEFYSTSEAEKSTTQNLVDQLTSQLGNSGDHDVVEFTMDSSISLPKFVIIEDEADLYNAEAAADASPLVPGEPKIKEKDTMESITDTDHMLLDEVVETEPDEPDEPDEPEFDINNPFGERIVDELGNELQPGTAAYLKVVGDRSKCNKRSKDSQVREYANFAVWVKAAKGTEVWVEFAASRLPVDEVDTILAGYIHSRINKRVFKKTKKIQRLDPNTMGPVISKLNKMIEQETTYRPNFDQRFELFKEQTRDYCKQSAKVPGMGQLMGTMDPLTPAELAWILQSGACSVWLPKPLVQKLYLLITCVFNLRCEEVRDLTFGNFFEVYVGDTVAYIILVPAQSKMRSGNMSASARTFKRPIAAMSMDPDSNLSILLAHLKRRIHPKVLEEYKDNPEEMSLWWEAKNVVENDDDCFFTPRRMGESAFNKIVKNAFTASGLARMGRKIANSTLRTSTFNLQNGIAIDAVSRQSFSGHTTPNTSIHYMRRDTRKNHTMGSAVMKTLTGAPVVEVDWECVMLRDGQKKYPFKMAGTPVANLALMRDDEDDRGVTLNVADRSEGEEPDPVPGPSGVKPAVQLIRSESSRSLKKHKSSPSARKFPF